MHVWMCACMGVCICGYLHVCLTNHHSRSFVMQCKRVFIRCVHLTGTQSTLYKNNKVNKIYSQPSGQWITSNYINELQHFTEHHCIVAKQYLVIFRGSWRVSSEGCADRIPDLSRGDVDLCWWFSGWRPAFRYYNKWASLVGFLICLVVMFLIQWLMALSCVIIVGTAFMYVKHVKPGQCSLPSSPLFLYSKETKQYHYHNQQENWSTQG